MVCWRGIRYGLRLDTDIHLIDSPGRFFAAVELEIALAYMVLNYDMKFEDGRSRPPNVFLAAAVYAAPNTTVMFKARPRPRKTLRAV